MRGQHISTIDMTSAHGGGNGEHGDAQTVATPSLGQQADDATGDGGSHHREKAPREAWNKRILGFQGPAQPSPTQGDAPNAGYRYLEVKCLGCSTHQTVALDIVRRPKGTPIHELNATCVAASVPKSGGPNRTFLPGSRRNHSLIDGEAVIARADETPDFHPAGSSAVASRQASGWSGLLAQGSTRRATEPDGTIAHDDGLSPDCRC